MSVKVLSVRLTDADVFPRHGDNPGQPLPKGSWKKWRGKTIKVYLPSEKPISFTCNTRQVWIVAFETLAKIGLKPSPAGYFCVCEHQIQGRPR
jgi:hypothetical protein